MSWADAGSASESAAAPRNAERTRRSVRAAMLRSSGGWRERAGGLALARRALVHQPLQREGGDADDDQRAPGEVVVAGAVEYETSHPGAEERADLVAEEDHAVEGVEMREAEHAADDPGDERRDAQPQKSHRGGEDEGRSRADRRGQEGHDEQRAQEVDHRQQVLLAVARAEQPEHVGADGVEEADQRERACPYSGRNAAELQVRGQVRGDEHELEAAREERERHEEIAAMSHRPAQRIA